MKKTAKFLLILTLSLLMVAGIAACDNGDGDNDPQTKDITVSMSQSGATEAIIEFSVRDVIQEVDLELGDNELTIAVRARLEAKIQLEQHYLHTLKINDVPLTANWSGSVANYSFDATEDTTIELVIATNFHKITVKIEDNTDGLADFAVKFNDEEQDGEFEINSYEAFKLRQLTTEVNADYRFLTTVDCVSPYGGYNANSEGRNIEGEPWKTITLYNNDKDEITVRVDVEFAVRVDVTNVPEALRPNVKLIAVDSGDIPSGVTDFNEIIEFAIVLSENKGGHITEYSAYAAKGAMVAVVVDDGEGNLSFFPRESVDETSVISGFHTLSSSMTIKIGNI